MNTQTKTRKLIEASLMIAVATVLSLLKILDLPYGGSVTLASMLPIVIIACRNGVGWGLASGAVYGAIQQLLGLDFSDIAAKYSVPVCLHSFHACGLKILTDHNIHTCLL